MTKPYQPMPDNRQRAPAIRASLPPDNLMSDAAGYLTNKLTRFGVRFNNVPTMPFEIIGVRPGSAGVVNLSRETEILKLLPRAAGQARHGVPEQEAAGDPEDAVKAP